MKARFSASEAATAYAESSIQVWGYSSSPAMRDGHRILDAAAYLWCHGQEDAPALGCEALKHRNVNGAIAVFNEAGRNGNGSEPERTFADA